MSPEALTAQLHATIPLTAAMATEVRAFDGRRLEISAPLEANRNLHGTAFGGSLATLGILGGWSLIASALDAIGIRARIVVQHSECEFREPVSADFTAVSELPNLEWPRFVATLRRHRRARVAIETTILAEHRPMASHRGRFAAFLEFDSESSSEDRAPSP